MKYDVVLRWSDEDDAFIAEVPELAGCAADGETYQEALSNVEVIIEEWMRPPNRWAVRYLSHEVVWFLPEMSCAWSI